MSLECTLSRRSLLTLLGSGALAGAAAPRFEASWESLAQYRCPSWFRDAKLGIFLHWGPMSVPGVDAWYARNMYIEGSRAYEYHVKTYGHPSKFGYKDIIPLWKAGKFDADALTATFKKAGARYIVPVAVHHDNFDCWNSKHTRWNSVNLGPHKDIVGLWRKAALKNGMRFGVSEHLARSYSWLNTSKGHDKQGPMAGVPYDGNDPKYRDFYFEPHGDTNPGYPKNPPDAWKQQWLDRVLDLVDSYRPDLLYTDGALPFGDYGLRMVAHLYNENRKWHNGRLEAVYNIKNFNARGDHGEFRDNMCVEDLERGVLKAIKPEPWQTDTCIGNWFYYTRHDYKSPGSVVHSLVDIVSKNGNLLLNIPLKPEGDLDEDAAKFLDGFGAWMAVNGEALHGTRPWKSFGEGPTQPPEGQFNEGKAKPFTPDDVRFTAKGKTVYAILMGWPGKPVEVKALAGGPKIAKVELLGSKQPPKWSQVESGLHVELPADKPCDYAFALKLTLA